jgi:hypothetical protein
VKHTIRVDDLWLENLPPPERQQLASEMCSAAGGGPDFVEVASRPMGRPELLRDELGVSINHD